MAGLANPTDDKKAAAAGLPPVDSISMWPYLQGALGNFSPRKVLVLGTTVPGDAAGAGVRMGVQGVTGVNGVIVDQRVDTALQSSPSPSSITNSTSSSNESKGLWKVLTGNISQNGWQGPTFPNASTNWDGDHAIADCDQTNGCLFNIEVDPAEHVNLATTMPEQLAGVKDVLAVHSTHLFSPDRGGNDPAACTAATGVWGGFWGPFVLN
jgi:hypothetical protein